MKKYIELTIDNVIVDLPPAKDLQFKFTYKISENGIVTASSARRPITLPPSKTNVNLFDNWHNASTINPSAIQYKQCICTADGLPIFVGKARLNGSDLGNQGKYFRLSDNIRVELYGNNADWFLDIKDLQLNQLDFAPYIFDIVNVILGLSGVLNSESGFCLIKWKEWDVAGQVSFQEHTPFIYLKAALYKIIALTPYTLDSTFFESDLFAALVMPLAPIAKYPQSWSNLYVNLKAHQAIPLAVIGGTGLALIQYDTLDQVPANNPLIYNTATGQYTVAETGTYQVTATIVATIFAPPPAFPPFTYFSNVVCKKNGFTHLGTGGTAHAIGDTLALTFLSQFNAGDVLEFYFETFAGTATINGGTLEIIGEVEAQFGGTISPQFLMKDWLAKDFINGLTHAFNLVWEADTTNNILRCEPADSYEYRQRSPSPLTQLNEGFYINDSNDITPKLDLSKQADLYPLQDDKRTKVLDWITDDATTEELQKAEPLGVFAAQYQHPLGRYEDAIEVVENPFFAKTIALKDDTINAYDLSANRISPVTPQIPLVYPSDWFSNIATETDYESQPRILFFYGVRGLLVDGAINFGGGAYRAHSAIFFTNYNDPTGNDPSLSFSDESFLGVTIKGMLWRYHLQQFVRKTLGKQLKEYLYLKDIDILNLSFRNKLLIDNKRFVLQEVRDYNTITEASTEIYALYDETPDVDALDRISNTKINGVISNG